MEFQAVLLRVERALDAAEVHSLAFLCTDLLQRDVGGIAAASDLFSLLQKQDLLSAEKPHLLTELLHSCKRRSLIRQLNLPTADTQYLSPFRKMLLDLSENITEEELKRIKFLLHNNMPRYTIDKCNTMLKLLQEMEKQDLLDSTNVETLEMVIGNVNPSLKKRIGQYKREHIMSAEPVVLQETDVNVKMSVSEDTSSPLEVHPPLRHSDSVDGRLAQTSNSLSLLSTGDQQSTDNQLSTGDQQSMDDRTEYSHHMSYTSLPEEKNLCNPPAEQKAEASDQQELGVYKMAGERRGYCLIINNYDFSKSWDKLKNREGTHVDEKNLEAVFRWLGFETQTERDCSRERILSLVKELSGRDHSRMDCVACCVMSHGLQGVVYGVDGGRVRLDELMAPFSGRLCASLLQKPKLFFVQACQGTREQEPVFIQPDGPSPADSVDSDARVPRDSFPADADFLLGMATVPHYASFRDKVLGTWYIQSLCQKMLLLVPRGVDLLSILTEVNNEVGSMSDQGGTKKQMPQPAYSLRKKVIFPPPQKPAPSLHSPNNIQ